MHEREQEEKTILISEISGSPDVFYKEWSFILGLEHWTLVT